MLDASKLYEDEAGVEPPRPGSEGTVQGGEGDVGGGEGVRQRIRKMLELGLHRYSHPILL